MAGLIIHLRIRSMTIVTRPMMITTIKPFKVSLHILRIPILFKDCPLGVSERRRSRNEDSISEQIHRPDCACQKP